MGKRTVTYRPTQLGTGYGSAAAGGEGVNPGAHPEYEKGPQISNPIKQVGDAFKKMWSDHMARREESQNSEAKFRGQMAFYKNKESVNKAKNRY